MGKAACWSAHPQSLAVARRHALAHSEVGYPIERLQRERAAVLAFQAASSTHHVQAATSKAGTADYRAAMAQLEQWMRLLRAIARTQLRRRPDLLAALGI